VCLVWQASGLETMFLRVRIEQGIPKLLVKVNPAEANGASVRNLGEVTLKKCGGVRGHVAVLHLSNAVARGELLMSLKLAELLDIEEDEQVDVCCQQDKAGSPARIRVPAPSARASAPSPPVAPAAGGGALPGRILSPIRGRVAAAAPAAPAPAFASAPAPPLPGAEDRLRHAQLGRARELREEWIRLEKSNTTSFNVGSQLRTPADWAFQQPQNDLVAPLTEEQLRDIAGVSGIEHASAASSAAPYATRSSPPGGYPQQREGRPLLIGGSAQASAAVAGSWERPRPAAAPSAAAAGNPAAEAESLEPSPVHSRAPSPGSAEARSAGSDAGPAAEMYHMGTPQHHTGTQHHHIGTPQQAPTESSKQHRRVQSGGRHAALAESSPESSDAEFWRINQPDEAAAGPQSPLLRNAPMDDTKAASARAAELLKAAAEEAQGVRSLVGTRGGGRDFRSSLPAGVSVAMVPFRGSSPRGGMRRSAGTGNADKRRNSVLRKRTSTLGALQPQETLHTEEMPTKPVPSHWRPPWDTGGGLEKSELGSEITAEIRRWLVGSISGLQCSQVVLDRALTVLSNFKLASGCQLEVLGGPLGAIVGGYSDADWLGDEIFSEQPSQAIVDAFALLGFDERADGDWSGFVAEEVSLSYRRMCLRGHPSRGGAPRAYLKLQVAMEIVRAFAGEAGALEPKVDDEAPEEVGFVLSDATLARELKLSAQEAEAEAKTLTSEQLEEMNRALDEYILRQMCFKSEIVDEIARLHEDSAYAILGISSDATDAEIKRAYRLVARECHPDKGGDKEDFQELTSAYEKIMEQRRSSGGIPQRGDRAGRGGADSDDGEKSASAAARKAEEKGKSADKEGEAGEEKDKDKKGEGEGGEKNEGDEDAEEAFGEVGEGRKGGSAAQLLEKASKAAEEASRYAKTAAEFAHQAADAAETARQGREQGSHETVTKSIAHSAIVLTLTVVKAVRVVGYATLDVAAQCRAAAKRNPEATECSEKSSTAMTLGLEACESGHNAYNVRHVLARCTGGLV